MKTPIWPYIAVVACLFVLSLLAPHAWLRPGLPAPESGNVGLSESPSTTHQATTETAVVGTVTPGDENQVAPEFNSAGGNESNVAVLQLATPAQVAPIQPPVAEQIKLDVSVQETPALPNASTVPPKAFASDSEDSPNSLDPEVAFPQKESTGPSSEVAGLVPYSTSLIEGLRELSYDPLCHDWAEDIISLLESMHQTTALGSPESAVQFQKLLRRLSETPQLAEKSSDVNLRAKLLRLGYAAKRRVDIWYQVHKIRAQGEVVTSYSVADMQRRVKAVVDKLSEAEHAAEWRRYLLLTEVHNMATSGDDAARREIARRILRRIDSPQLSQQQVDVFERPPFKEFGLELRHWATESIDYLNLLDQIEEYERTGSSDSSKAIATSHDIIRWSAEPESRKLADLLNTHYRNANVRVALTADFFNRLLPEPQSYQDNVSGNIVGANVSGTSHTVNRLQVVLHPDNETWHIGLEAYGEVASDTAASKGPATFYNQGFARYHARKQLMVDRRGIRVWRAETNANSESELTGFETDFDPIPIIGWLARSVARSQHDQQYYSAKVETEEMVRNQASSRFDDEVHERLAAAEQKVKQKLIVPFEKISLKPTALDMSTTQQRVVARYRLADDNQLGAQTPRPQAPGDSLMSVQIHESALNNTLANLQLEGRRTELHKLYRDLANTFEQPELEVPEDIPEGVVIQFADHEAVRVRCDNGQLMLTIRIAELKSGRSKWNDFSVRAFYVPDANQLNANLVREGTLQIIGEPFGGERLALRVIFSKVLSKSHAFNVINKRLIENPHLSDCRVNQFVINDGWIGVGIGPNRAGELEQLAKSKKYHVEQQ